MPMSTYTPQTSILNPFNQQAPVARMPVQQSRQPPAQPPYGRQYQQTYQEPPVNQQPPWQVQQQQAQMMTPGYGGYGQYYNQQGPQQIQQQPPQNPYGHGYNQPRTWR